MNLLTLRFFYKTKLIFFHLRLQYKTKFIAYLGYRISMGKRKIKSDESLNFSGIKKIKTRSSTINERTNLKESKMKTKKFYENSCKKLLNRLNSCKICRSNLRNEKIRVFKYHAIGRINRNSVENLVKYNNKG